MVWYNEGSTFRLRHSHIFFFKISWHLLDLITHIMMEIQYDRTGYIYLWLLDVFKEVFFKRTSPISCLLSSLKWLILYWSNIYGKNTRHDFVTVWTFYRKWSLVLFIMCRFMMGWYNPLIPNHRHLENVINESTWQLGDNYCIWKFHCINWRFVGGKLSLLATR